MDVRISDLTKTFDSPTGPLPILRDVDLSLSSGDAVVVTGPSGSGKSTLLYILGTLESPTSGTVDLGGQDPFRLPVKQLAAFRCRTVGFVFQDHYLLPQCSVVENVLVPTLAQGGRVENAEQRAEQLLTRVGLGARLRHRPAQLSGGERQRVSICRALINEPALVLADEPTGNLDRKTAEVVGELLLEVSREQRAILVAVTHSLEFAARFERQYELEDGRLVERRPC